MTDKVYKPETIAQNPLPVAGEVVIPAGSATEKASADTQYTPSSFSQSNLPSSRLASAVISESINTQQRRILGNYSFGALGAIKISSKTTSAYVKISPDGILGVNSAGVTTFTIDGTSGSATFRGTLYALAGNIGGFTIESSYLYAGSGLNTAGISPADYPFWAGATYANRATAPFRITPAGALVADNATIAGDITATSGTIGGWTINATTITATGITLDSSGGIIVSPGDNQIVLIETTGVGYLAFYVGGVLQGLMRGLSAGAGGVAVVAGDFGLDNSYSYMIKGTGASYGGIGVPVNDTWLFSTDSNNVYIKNNASATMGLFAMDGTVPYFYIPAGKTQLSEITEAGNPSDGTVVIFAMDAGGGKTKLMARFASGASQQLALEP